MTFIRDTTTPRDTPRELANRVVMPDGRIQYFGAANGVIVDHVAPAGYDPVELYVVPVDRAVDDGRRFVGARLVDAEWNLYAERAEHRSVPGGESGDAPVSAPTPAGLEDVTGDLGADTPLSAADVAYVQSRLRTHTPVPTEDTPVSGSVACSECSHLKIVHSQSGCLTCESCPGFVPDTGVSDMTAGPGTAVNLTAVVNACRDAMRAEGVSSAVAGRVVNRLLYGHPYGFSRDIGHGPIGDQASRRDYPTIGTEQI